ncbi:FAD-binding and (Fe-S)-binding domain-containing protein [Geothrix sp. PMB-07]|uniref:FAD-binding and (Fe-S)-binding domain-containing protein n=1 Tax=Geothrix sp. PMB-07 TaxID=3068640 RepID=UPI002741A533|nr:FAD-binding and (Fe-S)-binding domain-containing protein [Geothrix sp. PMB-07]WLT33496.1 FAD-binding and (Fe-S)-binding domain-containing protein [Geothrix sp. PMB-07]
MTTATAASLRDSLSAIVGPDRVLDRPIDLVAFASDASFYRLIPKAVAFAGSVEDVRGLFRLSHAEKIPMTFRAAGTSLSGQSVSDGILVEVARNWRGIQVLEGGAKVKVQPGVIGAHVNHALKAFKAKMGPDPASINTCTVGGILSNNSSGMCCGVTQNAYHTLDSLTFVLPSGTVIDTASPNADEQFRALEPALTAGLLKLKADLLANPALAERIRAKYRMKNTTGYSLNAFIDFDRPVDIFRNLLVGSEGTLAFIAEAVLKSVPDLPVKVTAFLLFPDLHAACAAIVPLRDAGAAALELLDRASLRSVENQPGIPPSIKTLPEGAAALLVEFHGRDESVRADLERTALATTADLKLLEPARFTHDPVEQALFWKIRSGTFPSVGAVRKRGTTVLIEDVAFPIDKLADAAVDLTKLFAKHGYDEAIIFGHAKDGNLHFVITQSFNDQAAVDRYARFIDDVVELVVKKYDGALKAEHGTGRNMAPFVEAEWGPEAKAVMEQLKDLVDPLRLLNPGVILNADPKCHLADLKPMPGVEEEVDKCIECGYCEPKCPSRELTLTPRQRIVVRREMARLEGNRENPALLDSLKQSFNYMAVETCAADGLCATACPVSIDTGQLTKRFRKASHSRRAQKIALSVARNFATVEPVMRVALRSGHLVQSLFGPKAMPFITRIMKAFGASHQWSPEMPKAAKAPLPVTSKEKAQAIYFPACISRMMGHLPGEPEELSLVEALVKLAERAGVPVYIPLDVEGTCCGVPFSSKGFDLAHQFTLNRAIEKFWEWSDGGRLSIVMDTSPCTYGVVTGRGYLTPENQQKFDAMKIIDSTAFAYDVLLPRLQVNRKVNSVVLHPVCSLTKMNLLPKLEGVAKACADTVVVPRDAGCCGFAGDRGFTHAELTASATKHEAKEVKSQTYDGYYASSRTCEVGMTRSTGSVYRSFLYLLESATRPEASK